MEAVTAWHVPAGAGVVAIADMPAYRDDAQSVLAEAIAEMCATDTDVEVCPRVLAGRAAQVLVAEAEGAELLVLGNTSDGSWGSPSCHDHRHAATPQLGEYAKGRQGQQLP